jgi:hypothetical protein
VSERFIFIAAVALQKKITPAPNPNRVTRTGFRRAPKKTLGGWHPREDTFSGIISSSVYIVLFGKYRGKTLPETIARDLDWFFWVVPKIYG